jgi:hypothetical protein
MPDAIESAHASMSLRSRKSPMGDFAALIAVRSRRLSFFGSIEEPLRLLQPRAEVDRTPEDHRLVPLEVGHLSHGSHLGVEAAIAQSAADGLGDPCVEPCLLAYVTSTVMGASPHPDSNTWRRESTGSVAPWSVGGSASTTAGCTSAGSGQLVLRSRTMSAIPPATAPTTRMAASMNVLMPGSLGTRSLRPIRQRGIVFVHVLHLASSCNSSTRSRSRSVFGVMVEV